LFFLVSCSISTCFIKGKQVMGDIITSSVRGEQPSQLSSIQPRCYCFLRPKWGRPKTSIYTPSVFRIYADIEGWRTNEHVCFAMSNCRPFHTIEKNNFITVKNWWFLTYGQVYITDLVCYTHFHWFFNPQCLKIKWKKFQFGLLLKILAQPKHV
jgi:hypothetical protein